MSFVRSSSNPFLSTRTLSFVSTRTGDDVSRFHTVSVSACPAVSASGGSTRNTAGKDTVTTFGGRRLLRIREEKRKKEYGGIHNYPTWAKVLNDAFKHDGGLRAFSGNGSRFRSVSITACHAVSESGDWTTNSAAKGSGTTARGRRLLRIREEKRKREYDRLHNYPAWARVLEEACKNDEELRTVLGDSIGDPELMRKRVEERVRKKGRDFSKKKTGSVLAFKVSFRDFNPIDSFIWFELYGAPSDRDVDLIGSVIQAWYVMGRLGAFNSSNLQLANSSLEYNPLYDADKGAKAMPSSFHDIGDVEFQDNWGRVWVDLGTADFFSVDVLLNCLTVLSSEYLGIQQVVFGDYRMGDWEEGMTNPEYGYKYFKI